MAGGAATIAVVLIWPMLFPAIRRLDHHHVGAGDVGITRQPGRFGDQKYLDDWPTRFESVHVLSHLGGGLAPWNIQQYALEAIGQQVIGIEKRSGVRFPAVFYHFHQCQFLNDTWVDYGNYQLNLEVKRCIYRPYVKMIQNLSAQLQMPHAEGATHGFVQRLVIGVVKCC